MTLDSAFLDWHKQHGGFSSDSISIVQIQDMGRGVVATRNISTDELLFSIPRQLVLSIHTATLPRLLSPQEWDAVNHGWTGLILCMMYERVLDDQSTWKPYFDLMPTSFDSLMFWSKEELEELQASLVLSKIGREEAEQEYRDRIAPLLQARPDIFTNPSQYTLDLFHLMGSLILSRSFEVEVVPESEATEADSHEQDVSMEDANANASLDENDDAQEEDEDDSDEEDGGAADDVGMVPFADILNAKSGHNNARLFYTPTHLEMRATADISAGAQVYNTYAEPPNSDLLRRYGHVDVPNDHDVVEIRADMIADVVCQTVKNVSDTRDAKIDWMLELEDVDDVYALSQTDLIPDGLIQCALLFAGSKQVFDKLVAKNEMPKVQRDAGTMKLVKKILATRLAEYPTSLEQDKALLEQPASHRHWLALIVRIGEKELLQAAIAAAESLGSSKRKRETESSEKSKTKRAK